jgi:predicted ATP-grasp superfamily ATP-dependent carboligase
MKSCAVVVGGKLNGLGVCRSLGRGGVVSYVVDHTRLRAAMWSRNARQIVTGSVEGRPLLDCLLALRIALAERPFLVITDEMAVLTVSEHRQLLADKFCFRLPPHDAVLKLYNKRLFHEFAVVGGLPVPNAVIVAQPADISRIRALRFPVIIKPADKRRFHSGRAPRLAVADRIGDALKACEGLLETAGELIVQERAEGPDDSIYFCLFYRGRGAETVSMFTGRKLASNPPGTGSTAVCAEASEARHILERLTRAFLERVDYSGFGSVEYKWDRIARRFVIIEPTVGRTDWQEEIATLCGVNIPLDAYRYEMGLSTVRSHANRQAIVWQASYTDRLFLRSNLIPPNAAVYDGYWRIDDPLPALVHYPLSLCVIAGHRLSRWLRLSGPDTGFREGRCAKQGHASQRELRSCRRAAG